MSNYTYMLVRYVHDPVREESINIGMLFYSPDKNFIRFSARKGLRELRAVFPDIEISNVNKYLKSIANSFSDRAKELSTELPFIKASISELAYKILPRDDSAVQWGRLGGGVSRDLEATFEALSERFVQQKPSKVQHKNKSDSQVWRKFKHELEQRNLLSYFTPKVVNIGGFSEEYKYTYQNGVLHCLKPLSLDLSTEQRIKEKVYKEAGQNSAASADNDAPELEFYYLLGRPSDPTLEEDFEKARKFLANARHTKVFTEDNTSELSDYLEERVNLHH